MDSIKEDINCNDVKWCFSGVDF